MLAPAKVSPGFRKITCLKVRKLTLTEEHLTSPSGLCTHTGTRSCVHTHMCAHIHIQTHTHRIIKQKRMLRSPPPSESLEADISAWAQGQLFPAADSEASSLPSTPLPSCLHLLNSAFNKLSSLIQLRVASVSSWDYFSWKTACPTPTLPPSLFPLPPFSFEAGGSVGLPITLLICSVAGLVPGWSGTEYSFFRSRWSPGCFSEWATHPPTSQALHPGQQPTQLPLVLLRFFFLIEDQFHFPV